MKACQFIFTLDVLFPITPLYALNRLINCSTTILLKTHSNFGNPLVNQWILQAVGDVYRLSNLGCM